MQLLIQSLLDGALQGSVLSLAAVGFSLVFGVLGVINLSHGVFILAGAYGALWLRDTFQIEPVLAIPIVAIVLFFVGYVFEKTVLYSAIRRTSLLASLLVTYGVALILQNAYSLVFSPDIQSLRPAIANLSLRFGDVQVNYLQLLAFALSLALVGLLAWILNYSRLGRIIRATAQQDLGAQCCGIDVAHTHALTFGIACAFAGAAGVIVGMMYPFTPSNQEHWTIYAFVVVVLGGIGSAAGALLGGLLLGIIGSLATQFIGAAFPNAMIFLILVVMLILRPNGILGNAFGESR